MIGASPITLAQATIWRARQPKLRDGQRIRPSSKHWGPPDYYQSPMLGSPWQCAKGMAELKSNNVECKCRKVKP
jgi:hypothetical protein